MRGFVRTSVSPGPKGVINDWRRFKLDSVDQTVPQSKRELLRQMSSPREDDKERLNRKVSLTELHQTNTCMVKNKH